MKNIVVIAVIGKNQVYSPGGYLFLGNRDDCDVHLGIRDAKRSCHSIFIPMEFFELAPEESAAYADCEVCIIDPDFNEEEIVVLPFPNALFVSSLKSALDLADDLEQKIFIFANRALYVSVIEHYPERISSIEVITLSKNFSGNGHYADPPPLQFQPVITKDEKTEGRKNPDYILHSWKNEAVHF
jgi:hypothetical protein